MQRLQNIKLTIYHINAWFIDFSFNNFNIKYRNAI